MSVRLSVCHKMVAGRLPVLPVAVCERAALRGEGISVDVASLLICHTTVEFVDDTYATVDKSWLFTTSRSTVTL